jgi:hypothetical protein
VAGLHVIVPYCEGVPKLSSFDEFKDIAFDFRISVSNYGESRSEQKFACGSGIETELI